MACSSCGKSKPAPRPAQRASNSYTPKGTPSAFGAPKVRMSFSSKSRSR